jgi:hypothetical protein
MARITQHGQTEWTGRAQNTGTGRLGFSEPVATNRLLSGLFFLPHIAASGSTTETTVFSARHFGNQYTGLF